MIVQVLLRLPRALPAAAAALLLLLAPRLDAGSGGRVDEPSWLAPLAPRSLLLGGTVAAERLVVVGERGHVLLSDDAGERWRQVRSPTSVTLTAVHFPTPRHGWAVGHDAVVLHSPDAGETWSLQYSDAAFEAPLLDVFFHDERRGFAVGAYGLFLETFDGGRSWSRRAISERDAHWNAIARTADGQLILAGEAGNLLRSSDGGVSWRRLASPGAASLFGALGLADGGLLVFGLQGRIHRTSLEAEPVWQTIDSGTGASLMGGGVGPAGEVVLGGIAGVTLVSRNGALDFELVQRTDRKAVAGAILLPRRRLLLFGEFGVQGSSDPPTAGPPAHGPGRSGR